MGEEAKDSTGESAETKRKERALFGVPQGDIAKMVLGALVGMGGTAFAAYWNSKEPSLRYIVSDPVQFQGESNKIGIVNVFVSNNGSKEAEALECSIRTKSGPIQELKATPEALKPSTSFREDKCEATLPLLNPGETLQLAILTRVDSRATDDGSVEVSVRAKGVTGEKGVESPKSSSPYYMIVNLVSLAVTVFFSVRTVAAVASELAANKEFEQKLKLDREKSSKDFEERLKQVQEANSRYEGMVQQLEHMRSMKPSATIDSAQKDLGELP